MEAETREALEWAVGMAHSHGRTSTNREYGDRCLKHKAKLRALLEAEEESGADDGMVTVKIPKELHDLAGHALESLEVRKGEDVDEWAKRLGADLAATPSDSAPEPEPEEEYLTENEDIARPVRYRTEEAGERPLRIRGRLRRRGKTMTHPTEAGTREERFWAEVERLRMAAYNSLDDVELAVLTLAEAAEDNEDELPPALAAFDRLCPPDSETTSGHPTEAGGLRGLTEEEAEQYRKIRKKLFKVEPTGAGERERHYRIANAVAELAEIASLAGATIGKDEIIGMRDVLADLLRTEPGGEATSFLTDEECSFAWHTFRRLDKVGDPYALPKVIEHFLRGRPTTPVEPEPCRGRHRFVNDKCVRCGIDSATPLVTRPPVEEQEP